MKKKYSQPQIKVCVINHEQMIAASTIKQDVYTDDPQNPEDALIKGEGTFDFSWE